MTGSKNRKIVLTRHDDGTYSIVNLEKRHIYMLQHRLFHNNYDTEEYMALADDLLKILRVVENPTHNVVFKE